MGKKRGVLSSAKRLALREIKREKVEKKAEEFLFGLALFAGVLLAVLVTSHVLFTGYATYVQSSAGYITKVNITRLWATPYWNGIYGLAIRVPGFGTQQFGDYSNEIAREDVFFDCIDLGAEGGNEVYASNTTSFDFNTLQPADLTRLDYLMGCTGATDCATNTFTRNISVMVGTTNITGVPASYTYREGGPGEVFSIGALEDASGNLVFVTHISSIQTGFSQNYTVNYQMLLPQMSTPQRYYYFTDPNDECPGGGLGNTVEAEVSGYVTDVSGNPLPNVTMLFTGNTTFTDSSGFYRLNATVSIGTYNVIADLEGYEVNYSNFTVTFGTYVFERNLSLARKKVGLNETYIPQINGYVRDTSGLPLTGATVLIGSSSDETDSSGFYEMYPSVIPSNQVVIAYKSGYDNNFTFVNLTSQPSYVSANITLAEIGDELPFPTGPFTQRPISRVIEEARKNGDDYWISTREIVKEVRKNTFVEEKIGIYNFEGTMSLNFALDPALDGIVTLDESTLQVPSNSFGELTLTLYGTAPLGVYSGNLSITGSLVQEIPITVSVVERRVPIEALLMNVELFKKRFNKGEELKYRVSLQNLLTDQRYRVSLLARVRGTNSSQTFVQSESEEEIATSLTLLEAMVLPEDIPNDDYHLDIEARYLDSVSRFSIPFRVSQPLYLYSFLGLPLWIYLAIISFLSFVLLNLLLYKRHLDKKKRYKIALDYDTLPKPGKRVVRVGHIAETKKNAMFEIDKLTTHAVVAGATGMGKSISAQVIIEEALMQGVCVIVFDPTAQWSGMLRKCEDKKMFSFYPKFGMKPSDARGFPGNIRAIKDARQIVDIKKHFEPGHIQIFTTNKLQPKDMDIFVANTIRQIFQSDPKEYPELKVLMVFDEVHRLLPKFGGSGEGFLQIERSCREFRKWGLGLLLISQVMNDFVGEIKANINTEVQTRTVEEGDLERIKSKYGESYLKSLVKSEVGVAMFQNADYNLGRPYFINFRPILHNTRRLSDEELDKYNQYNDQVDDLEYQIKQLEELKVDAFDLKMELKLVKDKIMTGNFSVVDIYLEGLKPRIQKQWDKLGKTPKKKEIKLASLEDIKKSVEEAKAESKKEGEKQAEQEKAAEGEKKSEGENIDEKLVGEPLTLDNGAMISSLGELKDVLTTLDDEVFKTHVTAEKNDFAKWFEQVDKGYAEKMKSVTDKAELAKLVTEYQPGAAPAKTEEKPAGETKSEDKKEEVPKAEEKKEEKKEEKPAEHTGAENSEESSKEKPKKEEEPKAEEKSEEEPKAEPKKEESKAEEKPAEEKSVEPEKKGEPKKE